MITIHFETLQSETRTYSTRKGETHSYERQTVEVSIGSKRRRVNCTQYDGRTHIHGLAVRFRTGTKIWPGSAVHWAKTGVINNIRPDIDKFTGQFCQLVGFFGDYEDSKARSQHNAVA